MDRAGVPRHPAPVRGPDRAHATCSRGYASLWFYADTGNQDALTFRNRVRQATTAAANRILFFTLWWRSLDDDEAEALLPERDRARATTATTCATCGA